MSRVIVINSIKILTKPLTDTTDIYKFKLNL